MGHIYMIKNKSNGKIYIGQTIRPIKTRLREHGSGKNGCRLIHRAIKKYGWHNFEKDWYECPGEDLNKHENWMINLMGTLAPDGYNLKEGGRSNGKYSDESKQKMSESQKGDKNHNFGKTPSEKTKQKLKEAHLGDKCYWYGKTPSDETKQKISKSNMGKIRTEETKQKMSESKKGENNHNSKRVYQYDLDGTFIGSFGSCGEAALYLNKKDGSKISKCARNKQKTAYDFNWSYVKKI